MTRKDSKPNKPLFKLEVTRNSVLIQALKPKRRALIVISLLLLLILIAIALTQPDLQSKCLDLVLSLLELALGSLFAPAKGR
jgi:hypothetical protein